MSNEPFDPAKYLSKVSGADYLEVKWRILWLRTEHPDAVIETEMMVHDGQFAVFKATVSLPGPAGSATGWGSESYNDFRDYIEKAESKALGRALAALGFGTQFAIDLDTADTGRIVDSPVTRSQAPRRGEPRQQASSDQRTEQAATPRQVQFIKALAREIGMSEEELRAESSQRFSRDVGALNRRDASIFIEELTKRRPNAAGVSVSQMTADKTVNYGPPDPPEPDDYEEVAMFNAAHADRFTN